jgi:hypothetical protein
MSTVNYKNDISQFGLAIADWRLQIADFSGYLRLSLLNHGGTKARRNTGNILRLPAGRQVPLRGSVVQKSKCKQPLNLKSAICNRQFLY